MQETVKKSLKRDITLFKSESRLPLDMVSISPIILRWWARSVASITSRIQSKHWVYSWNSKRSILLKVISKCFSISFRNCYFVKKDFHKRIVRKNKELSNILAKRIKMSIKIFLMGLLWSVGKKKLMILFFWRIIVD